MTLIVGYLGVLAANRSQVEVRGWSMGPTLWPGDRLLTVPWPGRAVRAGQLVVVRDPEHVGDGHHLIVKRVAAVERGGVRVCGDDPHRSTDSRHFGPLTPRDVRRLVIRRWPDWRTPLVRPADRIDDQNTAMANRKARPPSHSA